MGVEQLFKRGGEAPPSSRLRGRGPDGEVVKKRKTAPANLTSRALCILRALLLVSLIRRDEDPHVASLGDRAA